MHSAVTRFICRVLIVMMAWTPFQLAQAGMIGTDRIAAPATQSERAGVLALLGRADVASGLQAYGVDAADAKARVAAMSDDEVRALAGKLNAVPAGGDGVVVLVLVGVILWLVFWRKR